MTRNTGARAFGRMRVLFLLGATVAACDSSPATGSGPSHSATPVVSSSTSATASPIASTPDSTTGWPTFSSASGKLSFRYEPTWKPNQCAPNDSPLIVLGYNICGQIEPSFGIDSAPSAHAPAAADLRCNSSQPAATSSSTIVDGVTGTKEYIDYTSAAYNSCRFPIMHAVVYSFYTRGRAYTLTYLYIPSEGADQTSNVDEMVQALRFTA
jgi:hypothetical protein